MDINDLTKETSFITELVIQKLFEFGPRLLGSLLVLFIGIKLINRVVLALRKLLLTKDVDKSLVPFLTNLLGVVLKVVLFIMVATTIGIQTTSLLALIGSAGLAVGLALQGSLGNLAGGVLILILKPFKVDDFIEARGRTGTVREILLFYTILETPQGQIITIPNGGLTNDTLVNFSKRPNRRMDLTFGISYTDDIDKARAVIQEVIDADERILKEPAPNIFVANLGDSSVDFSVRVWVETANAWPVNFAMIENVKKAFDKNGVSIPFPQRDVHLYEKK
ncbi:MAG: mechanosensitive ion channel family protein [Luteibaculaceae bacterium]